MRTDTPDSEPVYCTSGRVITITTKYSRYQYGLVAPMFKKINLYFRYFLVNLSLSFPDPEQSDFRSREKKRVQRGVDISSSFLLGICVRGGGGSGAS